MARVRALHGKKLYQVAFWGVIFTVAAIGALAYWGVRDIRKDAAVVAVESAARGLSGTITVLLNAVKNSNNEFGDGVVSSMEPKALRKEFQSIFKGHAQVRGAILSDADGLVYMLSRHPDGVVEAMPDASSPTGLRWALYRTDGTRDVNFKGWEVERTELDAILADELGHLQPNTVNWRSSSKYQVAAEPRITASSLVESDSGDKLMLSFVFPLSGIITQLRGAERGSAERIFMYWDNGVSMPVNGLGTVPVSVNRTDRLLSPDEVVDPVIRGAVNVLHGQRAEADAPFSYVVNGEVWWGYAIPLSVFGDTLSLGVAVPRRNVVSTLTSDRFLQGGAAVLILFAGGVLVLLHRNRARIEAMGMRREAAVTENDVLELVHSGESGRLEFKQTLRFNLKSGKNGKEIEHACLKTVAAFLNSEGGTLLIGVADDGTIPGHPEDKFTNDDHALLHFNNLVSQHIGTGFSPYIDSKVITVQGSQVLRIHCIPAGAPAFLNMGKAEEFYIRSGPASRNLTLSQFYEWVSEHR